MTHPDCHVCANEARFEDLPPRERIAHDAYWRVAHAFDSALPGWLVLLPRRHVTAVHDLTDAEADVLGRWQVRLSRALRDETGCVKTYVMQFAEAAGFGHVHFHVVPRSEDLPDDQRGPAVFALLGAREGERVTEERADRLALVLRERLGRADAAATPE
ncbi:HIT family protein [Streptomyces sp. KL116D]|uniref:HIT family protein n=1 Tax=Streptomyces sp. KL116D TaxID=3045152 RepID=UPI003558BA62